MLQKMEAEIVFHSPHDVNGGLATLIENDFSCEILEDMIDEFSPAVFVRVRGLSELSDSDFFNSLEALIEPVGGEVLEAGFADQYMAQEIREALREYHRHRPSHRN